jgi:hypothetical protein
MSSGTLWLERFSFLISSAAGFGMTAVRSVLVSIARSFPVGAVMLLETGGDVRFQVRPIENVVFDGKLPEPEKLILDGQQRLTSLTQVLALDRPMKTFDEKRNPISRYY